MKLKVRTDVFGELDDTELVYTQARRVCNWRGVPICILHKA